MHNPCLPKSKVNKCHYQEVLRVGCTAGSWTEDTRAASAYKVAQAIPDFGSSPTFVNVHAVSVN